MRAKLMGIIHRGKVQDDHFGSLEANLDEALQPVEPRPEYIRRLRYQIVHQYQPVRAEIRAERQRTAIILGAGVLGAALAVVMGVRMVVTIVAGIGLLLQLKKRTELPAAISIRS